MFVRENEYLWEVKNIAEEMVLLNRPEAIRAQALRILELLDKWQKSESQRSEESSYLMKYLSSRSVE